VASSHEDPPGCVAERADRKELPMTESVYAITEVVGTSTESWERAAANAIERAARSLRDLRVAEVVQLDMTIDNGSVQSYRARVKISFKHEGSA
jgi:dodecin